MIGNMEMSFKAKDVAVGPAPRKAGECFLAYAFGQTHTFKATLVNGDFYMAVRVRDDYMVVRQRGRVSSVVFGTDDTGLAQKVMDTLTNTPNTKDIYRVINGATWRNQ